ncbi:uncharacterized protein si:dkeyp-69c1.9 isoform X2 [Dunckerocampus dactyliophorus]|nr:uncharacterized protein si:dkeyp-69c1.9 isoform X2 [Dunckerocampus dactyliophorus]XP_054611528.1 uncharacterized protein si:dkeyp-69c1.9 isoform X2 [Dunckerocampus dactyliophorus]XP_054611529.1 uncharacterized protein si:dkeyp-69c1.9 isoform X2 [Dunckerocampus dactyliophorus]
MEPSNKMFMENLQHSRRHHNFFLRARPYRGELPTVAGFLLYPDTPAKMETTSHDDFCFKTVPQRDKGMNILPHSPDRQEVDTAADMAKRADPVQDPQAETMRSQYQKDFPPPSSWCRRSTPALPQPDNIGINPAFRIDFRTVQRDTFPDWAKPKTGVARSSQTY